MQTHKRLALLVFVLSISLQGCGVGLCISSESCSGIALLEFASGREYNFGTHTFSTTVSSTIVVTNSGGHVASAVQPNLSSSFQYAGGTYPGTGGTCSDSIESGASCTISVIYTAPSQLAATQAGTLQLGYFNGGATDTATLSLNARSSNGSFISVRGFREEGPGSIFVYSVYPTSQGLLVGGYFDSYSGTSRPYFLRLKDDFSLDGTLDVGTGFDSDVYSIAEDTSLGRIYVGGAFANYQGTSANRIVALRSDGSRDTSFNTGTGFSGGYVETFAVLPSSDIIVGGSFTSYDGTAASRIVRLNSNGSVDTAFAYGTGFNGTVEDFALDGTNVYVVGNFTQYKGIGQVRAARLDSSANLDAGFVIGAGFTGASVNTVSVSSDGSGDVYFGGDFIGYAGNARNRIVRTNSNGTIDNGFAVGTGFSGGVDSIIPAPGLPGVIYVGGTWSTYKGVATPTLTRILANGTVDPTFALSAVQQDVYRVAAAVDGTNDIFAGGDFRYLGNVGAKCIARVKEDGTASGLAYSRSGFFSNYGDSVRDIVPLEDGTGRLFVGGLFQRYDGTNAVQLTRLNYDGSIDTTFSEQLGLLVSNSGTIQVLPYTDGTGRVLVGGEVEASYGGVGRKYLARLLSDGAVDTSFPVGAPDSGVWTMAFAEDGSGDIYIGGNFFTYSGTASAYIRRLNSDGSVDTGFNIGAGFNSIVYTLVPAGDGSGDIYVGGNFTSYAGTAANRIIRLTSTGAVQTSFAYGSGYTATVQKLVVHGGKLYVGTGAANTYKGSAIKAIHRLLSDGSVDSTFDIGGTGPSSGVEDILPTTLDGETVIYIGGGFWTINGTVMSGLARLKENGTIDTSFEVNGGFNSAYTVRSVALARDGSDDIYVGGMFFQYQGTGVDSMARLNASGQIE